MLNPKYANKVKLLIKCLPSIASEECFAIKGGTAINLFCLDLPRLSVDIDIPNLDKLPVIKWKLKNLETLQKQNSKKFQEQYSKLKMSL